MLRRCQPTKLSGQPSTQLILSGSEAVQIREGSVGRGKRAADLIAIEKEIGCEARQLPKDRR